MELVYFLASGAVRLAIIAFLPRLSTNSKGCRAWITEVCTDGCYQRDIGGAYMP